MTKTERTNDLETDKDGGLYQKSNNPKRDVIAVANILREIGELTSTKGKCTKTSVRGHRSSVVRILLDGKRARTRVRRHTIVLRNPVLLWPQVTLDQDQSCTGQQQLTNGVQELDDDLEVTLNASLRGSSKRKMEKMTTIVFSMCEARFDNKGEG